MQTYVVLMDWLTQMETFFQIVDRLGLNHPVIFLKDQLRKDQSWKFSILNYWCDLFTDRNDDDFNAQDMCCICGGGIKHGKK